MFALPTTGYEDVSVTFTTRRSGSGAGTQIWSYTTDGTNYVSKDTIIVADADPVLRTLSYLGISGVDNNPNFKVKVGFYRVQVELQVIIALIISPLMVFHCLVLTQLLLQPCFNQQMDRNTSLKMFNLQ